MIKTGNFLCFFLAILFSSCEPRFDHGQRKNSPTSGDLTLYYEAALHKHVNNQAYTFQRLYPNTRLRLCPVAEDLAVKALYDDSCESIVITRPLNSKELKAFASKRFDPKYSMVATTALALICNTKLPVKRLRYSEVLDLVKNGSSLADSNQTPLRVKLFLDRSGSGLSRYLLDTLLHQPSFPAHLVLLNSAVETLNAVSENEAAIGLIDFAWLSDSDDSLVKAYAGKVRLLPVGNRGGGNRFELPSQSSFKLGLYPFSRNIYVYRKTGDFTLAKGFESFVAGPKGQTIFLKQGLLPSRQQERNVTIRMEASAESEK